MALLSILLAGGGGLGIQIMLLASHKADCAAVASNHCEHLGCRDPFGLSTISVGRHAEALRFPALWNNLEVRNAADIRRQPQISGKQLIIRLYTKLQHQVAIIIYTWSTTAAPL